MTVNHTITLVRRPRGMPVAEDFDLRESVLPDLPDGHVQVKVEILIMMGFVTIKIVNLSILLSLLHLVLLVMMEIRILPMM